MLREYGDDPRVAKVWEVAAVELDEALRNWSEETLNLADAAKLSGYTAAHLSDLVRQGKIPNAGRLGAPRIRRADIPIKSDAGIRGRSPSSPSSDPGIPVVKPDDRIARLADRLR